MKPLIYLMLSIILFLGINSCTRHECHAFDENGGPIGTCSGITEDAARESCEERYNTGRITCWED